MGKKKKRKVNKKSPVAKVNIQELMESRDGGQIALRGYSYQFLYSCNLILSSDADTVFALEGIEDIDSVKYSDGSKTITHIQLKYSTQRQDASFMDSVLKNYLEAYLLDKNRNFKLVYDFSVATGNLSKLFLGNLDKNAKEFWKTKIDSIKKETSLWNWNDFVFEDFIQRLSLHLLQIYQFCFLIIRNSILRRINFMLTLLICGYVDRIYHTLYRQYAVLFREV